MGLDSSIRVACLIRIKRILADQRAKCNQIFHEASMGRWIASITEVFSEADWVIFNGNTYSTNSIMEKTS